VSVRGGYCYVSFVQISIAPNSELSDAWGVLLEAKTDCQRRGCFYNSMICYRWAGAGWHPGNRSPLTQRHYLFHSSVCRGLCRGQSTFGRCDASQGFPGSSDLGGLHFSIARNGGIQPEAEPAITLPNGRTWLHRYCARHRHSRVLLDLSGP